MLTRIRAVDSLELPHPPETIWPVLANLADYPRWWPADFDVRVIATTPELVGSEVDVQPPRGIRFRARVESVEPLRRLRFAYLGRALAGHGEWRLEPLATGTRVVYDLDVQAGGWLVALLARVMSLDAVHSRQMASVLRHLASEVRDRARRRP